MIDWKGLVLRMNLERREKEMGKDKVVYKYLEEINKRPGKTKLKCQNCGYLWRYKGRGFYATCPKCLYKVNVKKAVVK